MSPVSLAEFLIEPQHMSVVLFEGGFYRGVGAARMATTNKNVSLGKHYKKHTRGERNKQAGTWQRGEHLPHES